MNTFQNVLGISAVIALVLLPALIGIARELRIDRELRDAERSRRSAPPETADAEQPVKAARRPQLRSWARI
ncbi:hypothetical protein ACPXCP_39205 [Streptomyces sp. DT20]|uniref:hypothetical protein n=1 Tax=unclassified Streptomyces TaxID=2593676 RepID=UPI0009405DA2|nr:MULTISPECIES: hypothetical protein [unclassified Streptomyces]OKK15924.1 hypothetical protein AMK09_24265 [Streptomyces sp. CB02488]